MFGSRKVTDLTFQIIFLVFIVIGSSSDIMAVMDFSDMMILAMAFPNLVGLYILAPELKRDMDDYWARLKGGKL
jgi:AGCS family alanine or glycine:cation symporter